ncbi:MAG: CRISPR-associated endonuclease Cas2 [Chthoniobacterales bacterium]|nr:CRISPR-associated endonuclease Cas2 [Chthoniobacterales bacterium]
MLAIVAYDISDPKRLAKVARYCEDHGVRVQYSIFECRLETARFEDFWLGLEELIDPKTDRIVAYHICASCARSILSAGTMETTSTPAVAYVF